MHPKITPHTEQMVSLKKRTFEIQWCIPAQPCSILLHYITLCTRFYVAKKLSWLPYHDNFFQCNLIATSMKNTIATPGPPWLPSLAHPLWPSCYLVWSDLHFMQSLTISNMWILLHCSPHDEKPSRWEIKVEFHMYYSLIYFFTPLPRRCLHCYSFLCC